MLEMFVGCGSTRVLPTIFFSLLCHGCRMDYSIWSAWLCKMLSSYALASRTEVLQMFDSGFYS